MVRISRTISMPTWLMSSSRPTNGLTNMAPAFAARSAHLADDLPALADHLLRRGRHHLGADRSLDDGADLPDDLQEVPPLLRHQGGVRGHPVQDAPGVGLTNLLDVRRIEKDLHALSSPSTIPPFPPDGKGC